MWQTRQRCACAGHGQAPAPGARTETAAHRPNRHWAALATGVQAKLDVARDDDPAERAADALADAVLESPAETTAAPCPACAAAAAGHAVQRAAATPAAAGPAPPSVRATLAGPGRALDAASRAWFEPRLGADLGAVRIHADAAGDRSARAIGARAYAAGAHIAFAAGEYAPHTPAGRHLLAHELAHVLQQGGGAAATVRRVPTRSGVRDGRYSYSNNCGWIDWSHADPSLATTLIERVQAASDALQAAGSGATADTGAMRTPTMTSRAAGVVLSSAQLRMRLTRPLSGSEVLAVALHAFKTLSRVFETQQQWTDLLGQSSFAQEDLPSNLIGFYRAAWGYTDDDIRGFCDALDADDSLAEYDRDHDFRRNRSFAPVGAVGDWPLELDDIDDSQAGALYEVTSIRATQGTDVFTFCPIYRVVGTLGETDLFIIGVGGHRFTAADNLRVVPTYRARPGTSGSYGHVNFIEVEPYSQPDFLAFHQYDIEWPIYVPEPMLECLTSQGNAP